MNKKSSSILTLPLLLLLVLLAVLLESLVYAQSNNNNSSSILLVVDTLEYKKVGEFAASPALSQPYYLVNFALDAPSNDLCSEVKLNETYSKYGNDLCTQYFCGCTIEPNICFNLTSSLLKNSTLRFEYFQLVNYCLYCNSETSQRFRSSIMKQSIESNQCHSKFPTYQQIMKSTLSQCNGGNSFSIEDDVENSSNSSNIITPNLGLIDWRIFEHSIYYSNLYSKNSSSLFVDNSRHMFETLFTTNQGPVLCSCRTGSSSSSSSGAGGGGIVYRYYCTDVYQQFFLPLKYCAIPFILFVAYGVFIGWLAIYCIVPHFYCKIKAVREQVSIELSTKQSTNLLLLILKHVLLEIFAYDVKPMVLTFLVLSMGFFSLENLFSFLYNFMDFQERVDPNVYWGVFRSFAIYFSSFSACSLLVKWSHVVDLIKTKHSKKKLSATNTFFLTVTYLFNISIMIAGIVLSSILSTSSYFFIVASISMVLFPTIYFIGFTIYGAIIHSKIRKTKSISLYHLKFTKFILFFNSLMLLIIASAFVFIPTFLLSWDVYGLFVGVFKNLVVDLVAMVAFGVISYILFLDQEFLDCYGEATRWLWPFTRRDRTSYEPPQTPRSPPSKFNNESLPPPTPSGRGSVISVSQNAPPSSTTTLTPSSLLVPVSSNASIQSVQSTTALIESSPSTITTPTAVTPDII